VELRHLRYFTAVAENGGFGRTARLLNVSQSAISEQIRDLEEELGVTLINREHRNIRLTESGEQFLTDARAVLASAERAVANVRRAQRGELGTLSIGFFVGGIGSFFPPLIREFRQLYRDVQVNLVEMPSGIQTQALENGSIDVGFTRLDRAASAALRSELFHTEPLYAVLPAGHPLAAKSSISLRRLEDSPFVLNDRRYSPAVFDKIISLCAEAGFSPRIHATASLASGVIALVEAGEGVAVLPQASRSLAPPEVVFVPLADTGASVDLVVAWSPHHDRPVRGSFLELVRKRRRL
jgi:DNA-binding transcriptional LysR family regulator